MAFEIPYGEAGLALRRALSLTGNCRGSPYRVPPEAAYTTFLVPVAHADSSTFSRPITFTLASSAGALTDRDTEACAATCMTTSGR